MSESILVLNGIEFPAGSARGIKERLSVIDNGELRRDVNGMLHNLTRATHRKYTIRLDCVDMSLPTLAETWRGDTITVHSTVELSQIATTTAVELSRPPVSGSVRAINAATGAAITVVDIDGTDITLDAFTGTAIVFYRPIFSAMLASREFDADEWAASAGWAVELEEV